MRTRHWVAAFLLVAGLGLGSGANAAVLKFSLCTSSCGNIGPGNTGTTVAELEITQNGNDVNFKFTNSVGNLGSDANGNTFISFLGFSYTGGLNVNSISLTSFTSPANEFKSFSTGQFTDAGYLFNLALNLETSNAGGGTNRFKNGEMITFTLTSSAGALTVAHFLGELVGANGKGDQGIVHIQSLANGDSVKFRVPEPNPLALWGLGLVLMGSAALRRRKGAIKDRFA